MKYERLFQAIGRLVDEQKLRDVCILEFEEGVIVQGYALVSTTEGWHLAFKTQTVGDEELRKLVDGL